MSANNVRDESCPCDVKYLDTWTLIVFGQHQRECAAGRRASKRHWKCDCGLNAAIEEMEARTWGLRLNPRHHLPVGYHGTVPVSEASGAAQSEALKASSQPDNLPRREPETTTRKHSDDCLRGNCRDCGHYVMQCTCDTFKDFGCTCQKRPAETPPQVDQTPIIKP